MPIRRAYEHVSHDIRRIRTKGSFSRNSFVIFSGNSLVIASQLILTPVIARIYGPESYGLYGLFTAVVMNLSSFADLGFSHAYVLPKDEERFKDLARLNIALLALVVILTYSTFLFRSFFFEYFPSLAPLGYWWALVPPAVALYSFSLFYTQWLVRVRSFKHSTMIGVSTALGIRSLNLVLGLTSKGAAFGLIIGELIMRTVATFMFWFRLRPYGIADTWRSWSLVRLRSIAQEYRLYPLMIFPQRWLSLMGQQVPIFLLADDLTMLGHYALAASLLLIPLRLFGFSFSPVYLQKAAESLEDPALIGRITKGLYLRLLFIGTIPFLMLIFFSDVAFAFVFGKAWNNAGVITSYLGIFFFMRLLTEPMVSLFQIQQKQHYLLIFHTVLTILRLLAMFFALRMGADLAISILVYAVISFIAYSILSVILLNSAGAPGFRYTLLALLLLGSGGIVFSLVRNAIFDSWWPLSAG